MSDFKINDKVKIKNSNIFGKITSINESKVMFRTLDLKTIITNISDIEKYEYTEEIPKVTFRYPKESKKDIKNEIMLRHLTKEEAIQRLEKFLSDSIMNNEYKVRIIHGKHRWHIKRGCS